MYGDNVEFDENQKVINKILERSSFMERPKVANISQIVFVISSKMPKPNLLMLDKWLIYAEYLKIKQVIVINKIDLDKKEAEKIQKIYKEARISSYTNKHIRKHRNRRTKKMPRRQHKCICSVNLECGKSTLTNKLLGNRQAEEGEISKKNKRGKNTTTEVTLYETEKNTYLLDTPGFQTMDIYEIESNNLENFFIEFRPHIKKCEFVGCTHIKEEKCGIKEALEKGKISEDRYINYIKIYKDLKDKEEHKW